MRYLVIIRRSKTGYSADLPDLPGCIAAARTVEKTRQLIGEAIVMHLELMRESSEEIPEPTSDHENEIKELSEEDYCTWAEVETPEPVSS